MTAGFVTRDTPDVEFGVSHPANRPCFSVLNADLLWQVGCLCPPQGDLE